VRSIALQGFVGLVLAAGMTGCTPSLQSQCQKYCQYLFLTCNAGPATQTEPECESTCAEPSPTVNGGACADPALFFNCVLEDQCSQLEGPAGTDALQGCALEASCTLPTTTGGNNNGGGTTSAGNSGGSTGGANNNGGSTNGGNSNGNNNNGGSTNGNNNGGSSNGNNNNGGSTNGNNNNGGSSNGNNNNGGSTNGSNNNGGSTSGGLTSAGSSGGTSGGTVPTIGETCVPPTASTDPDPCAADSAGLACTETATDVYDCELPGEFQACLPTPGCQTSDPPGMICQNNGAFAAQVCVNTCTSSVDCPDELTSCLTISGSTFCYYAFCGPTPDYIDGGFNGTTYYAPCDNAGTNDGRCLPFEGESMTLGICQAAGSMAAGALGCAQYRSATAGTSTLCADGTTCLEGSSNTFCAPVCGSTTPFAADGGPGCPASESCESLGTTISFGGCLEACTMGTTVCPTGMTCQAASGSSGFCSP
jgi:hypothetical protein